MKILIVEDNMHLVQDMQEFLQENGFLIEKSGLLEEARQKINIYQYDLVLLDLGLPDGNGLDLIPDIKKNDPSTGIIILTAKDTVTEKVKGLEMGADDYITKPFHKAELNARINSTLRRGKFNGNNGLEYGHIKINTSARQVLVNNTPLSLTKIEYDLLLYFMYNKDRMLTKESIVEHLWGDRIDESDSFNFIYNHIKNLRKKIRKLAPVNYIHSMYGIGYKFTDKGQD